MRETGPDRVTETDYVSATSGPNRDTESYYKATPAPGEFQDERIAPPAPTFSNEDSDDRLKLRPRKSGEVTAPKPRPGLALPDLPWLWILGGIVAVGGMTVVAGGMLVYLWTGGSNPPENPQGAEQETTEEWEGLKVKKGLQ